MVRIALAMSFASLLVIANVITVKLIGVGDWVLPAGVIAYPFTFLVTDTVSELYGRKVATRIVWYGFGISVFMVALVYVAGVLPPADIWTDQDAYDKILGGVPRIVLASMIAVVISQHHDVVVFHLLRRATDGRHLWLRNNVSTIISQTIDTGLFVSIAFAGTVPTGTLFNIMATQYVVKVGVAVVDTPLVYALVGAVRRYSENEDKAAKPQAAGSTLT